MSIISNIENPVITHDENFLRLPNIQQKREKFDSMIQESIAGLLESFHHVPREIKKEIKNKITLHVRGEINKIAKKLRKNPFANYLGLQGNQIDHQQFCSQLVLKHLETYIKMVNEKIIAHNQGSKNADMLLDRQAEVQEHQSASNKELGVLEDKLTKLRETNRGLLNEFKAKKADNDRLIEEVYKKIAESNRTQEEKHHAYSLISKLSLVESKTNIDPEILKITTCKRKRDLVPPDQLEFLTKKLKGATKYQQQLEKRITEANTKNQQALEFIQKEAKQNAPKITFLNGMTIEKWRELIPYEENPRMLESSE